MDTDKNIKREIASASPRNDKKEKRNRLLSALFAQAKKKGIGSEELRDVIAPGLIKKRLSKASPQEIVRVIEHLAGGKTVGSKQYAVSRKQYEPSRAGLIEELEHYAKERWGSDFQKPLNAFINSHLKVHTHYKFLNVTFLKGIKERLREMNQQRDSSASPQNDSMGRGA